MCEDEGWKTGRVCEGNGRKTGRVCEDNKWKTRRVCEYKGWKTGRLCDVKGWKKGRVRGNKGSKTGRVGEDNGRMTGRVCESTGKKRQAECVRPEPGPRVEEEQEERVPGGGRGVVSPLGSPLRVSVDKVKGWLPNVQGIQRCLYSIYSHSYSRLIHVSIDTS